MPEPRPLYALPALLSDQSRPVLVVEGEKTAAAAAKLFPDMAVTCWAGGCKALAKTDLQPLTGREVVYWPDADAPGKAAAAEFAACVPHAQIVSLPDGLPDGWDLADPLPEGIDPVTLIDAAARPHDDEQAPPTQTPTPRPPRPPAPAPRNDFADDDSSVPF